MALVLKDRVRETTNVSGTADAVLLGAVTGFQAFSVVGDTNTCYYTIVDNQGNWEVGIGTYSTTGPTLARTTVLDSSTGGSKISFPAGTKDIFLTYPAEVAVTNDITNTFTEPQVISVNSSTNALRITQTGAGNALVVEDSANPDSSPFVVDASGNVIKGNTTPITAYTFTPGIQQHGTGTSAGSYSANVWGVGVPIFMHNRAGTGGIGTYTSVVSGNELGRSSFAGADGSTFIEGAYIQAFVDAAPATGSMPGRLVFSTTPSGSSTPTERMRIDSAGKVGIGSSSLTGQNLRIGTNITGATSSNGIWVSGQIQSDVTSTANYVNATVTQAAATTTTNVRLFNAEQSTVSGTITNQFGFNVSSNLTGATNNFGFYSNIASGTGRWNFYANGTAANYFAGNVGIGTNSPNQALTVVGNISLAGQSTGDQFIRVGSGRSGNGFSYIDLQGDTTYANGLRLIRVNTGANAPSNIEHRGTGAFQFITQEAAPIVFSTSASERMRIDSSGNVGIGTSSPSSWSNLAVLGSNGTGFTGITSINSNANVGIAGIQFASDSTYTKAAIGLLRSQPNGAGSIVFYNDSNNDAANWSTGDEKLRITSEGNVGIGTTTPSNFGGVNLQVQNSTIGSILWSNGTHTGQLLASAGADVSIGSRSNSPLRIGTNDIERMRIDASGNVFAPFNTTTNRLVVGGSGTTASLGAVVCIRSAMTAGASLNYAIHINDSTTNTAGGANLIAWSHNAEDYSASNVRAAIGATIDGSGAGSLLFRTGGFSTQAERMRIDSSGNVGIGTSSPAQRLHVSSTSSGAQLQLTYPSVRNYTIGATSDFALAFRDADANSERMRIDSSGNVVIGVSSGSGKFRVYEGNAADCTINFESGVANYATSLNLWANNSTGAAFNNITSRYSTTENWYIGGGSVDKTLVFKTDSTERMRITAGGEVYIAGTTDQGAYNLQCNGTGVWGAGAYVNGSDERIKEDIAPIESGLDVVEKLNPVTYRYKEDWSKDQSVQTGFIAQELLVALEGKNYVDGVVQQGGEYMSVAYQNIIPILTKAIQEQQQIINDLKARIETLESK